MSRPRKTRNCSCPHREGYAAVYKPAGTPLFELQKIELLSDELEALHLCDGNGMTQQQAGHSMGVSRGTVQRLVSSARHKIARALISHAALVIGQQQNQPNIDQ